ncbi:response regulator transcription factor [Bacillus taeanensis]|uniref:DNA-binding response regulator n=1 Tax=Bacillus taeanensis TaxID=273032 RepID=A0A366XYA9_9BACI|nr:response regulator [Bacillus taeanensis]RBW69749.1 DNA-binding response regulator [Bacillus taeanensis]
MYSPTILVVDDEHNTRMGVSLTLQQWGKGQWDVDRAENGLSALEYLRKRAYDLLITDIRMPLMNGIELLETLREENNDVISILLTGFAEFEYAQKGLQLGAIDYLLKPIQQEQLIEAVEKALKASEKKKKSILGTFLLEEHGMQKGDSNYNKINNPSIESAIKYIDNNLDKPLTIKDTAQYVHLNSSYFSVLFKEETGSTYSEFVTTQRIKKAKELLIVSDIGLDEISEQVGYQTTSYFIKIFKRYEDMTPKQYRDRFLEKRKSLNKDT